MKPREKTLAHFQLKGDVIPRSTPTSETVAPGGPVRNRKSQRQRYAFDNHGRPKMTLFSTYSNEPRLAEPLCLAKTT